MIYSTAYIAEIGAWTGAQEETLRIGTHPFSTLPSDVPANVSFLGVITDIGAIDRSVFQGNGITGDPRVSSGYIELSNTGRLDSWLNYGFDGRTFELSRLNVSSLYSSRRRLFTGTLIGIDASNAWTKLRLLIRDRLQELDLPLLTERYSGTTIGPGATAEGNAEVKDQLKPWALGRCRNVTPILVNAYDLIYQVSKKAVVSIVVKWSGDPLTLFGNMLTLEALQAAVIPTGQYATCLERGMFRTANSPAGVVTADVVEGVNGASRTHAQIALRVMQEFGIEDIDLASVTAADAFSSAEAGIHIDTDESALIWLSKIMDSAGFALIPDLDGVFSIVILKDPSSLTPVMSFDLNSLSAGSSLSLLNGSGDDNGVPTYSVVMTFDRNYTPMDLSQLAGILSDADKSALEETFKTITLRDTSVRISHPLAAELNKDSLFAFAADANVEGNRVLNMLKVRRDRISLSVKDEVAEEVELGDCVLLTLSRFGFDSGKKFIVVGKKNNFRSRTIELSLWG